jgi:SAM-dependent methyltransferase
MLTRQAAKAFYDRFGARQDAQAFYEDPALAELIARADFESARHVFEFGIGTGRLAEHLLQEHLTDQARYSGSDISTTMLSLAETRLARYGSRVELIATDGSPACPVAAGAVDRIVSTYVLDLLSDADISAFLALTSSGRLCLVSLTYGETFASRLVTNGWQLVFRASPRLVGGCRPIRLTSFVTRHGYRVLHRGIVSPWGIASEVLVAEKVERHGVRPIQSAAPSGG